MGHACTAAPILSRGPSLEECDRNDEFFTRIRNALTDPEDWVREAAIWATSYSAWPQYRPLLEVAASNDTSDKVRTDAAAVLAGSDAAGIQS